MAIPDNRFALPLTLSVMLYLLLGCAAQPANVQLQPPLGKLALKPRPILVASAETDALSPEEEALFEDNLDDWDKEASEDFYTVADPFEGFNRAMFFFNDKLYFWVLKPVARGYRAVFPQMVRTGVKNFFHNLAAPIRLVNSILQGKGQAAEGELARFLYNSTVGVLGFGDPAKNHPGLNPDAEDLGQTLATYGIGDGFYIVWPVLGPSTLRDAVGLAGDSFLNPISYVEPTEASLALKGYNTVNTLSFRIGDYEALKKAALDPYEASRNAYIQLRQSRIKR